MKGRLFLLMGICFVSLSTSYAQRRITNDEYIDRYKDISIKEMKSSGIPASITLAQGMLESDCGNGTLAVKANNHFGIKCHDNWKGKRIYHDDDRAGECFRKYGSAEDSYIDHTNFLTNTRRYAFLFDYDHTDYKNWAKGLKKAGYATNPHYAKDLIRVIEDNELYKFDKGNVERSMKPHKTYDNNDVPDEVSIKKRSVNEINGVKSIVVKPGDTYYSITNEFQMMRWELPKYNDLTFDSILHPGDILYLQPKRWRAERGNDYHIVQAGESMRSISQHYAVKLNKLYRKNRMEPGTQPVVGQKIWLRKRKPKEEAIDNTSKPAFKIEVPADSSKTLQE